MKKNEMFKLNLMKTLCYNKEVDAREAHIIALEAAMTGIFMAEGKERLQEYYQDNLAFLESDNMKEIKKLFENNLAKLAQVNLKH